MIQIMKVLCKIFPLQYDGLWYNKFTGWNLSTTLQGIKIYRQNHCLTNHLSLRCDEFNYKQHTWHQNPNQTFCHFDLDGTIHQKQTHWFITYKGNKYLNLTRLIETLMNKMLNIFEHLRSSVSKLLRQVCDMEVEILH